MDAKFKRHVTLYSQLKSTCQGTFLGCIEIKYEWVGQDFKLECNCKRNQFFHITSLHRMTVIRIRKGNMLTWN